MQRLPELTDVERDFVLTLLRRRYDELLHELHHADARRFKDELRAEIALTERILDALTPVPA